MYYNFNVKQIQMKLGLCVKRSQLNIFTNVVIILKRVFLATNFKGERTAVIFNGMIYAPRVFCKIC